MGLCDVTCVISEGLGVKRERRAWGNGGCVSPEAMEWEGVLPDAWGNGGCVARGYGMEGRVS